MIKLSEYVNNCENISLLEKQLISHIYIEFRNSDFITFIKESHSLFSGCDEIVNFICVKLEHEISKNEKRNFITKKRNITLKYDKFTIDEISESNTLVESLMLITENTDIDVFFDELVINIDFYKGQSLRFSYHPEDNNYNKDTDKLKQCILNISLPVNLKLNDYIQLFKKKLVYELTHAYEDYNRLRKVEIDGLSDILKQGTYKKSITKFNSDNAAEKFIRQYMYLINKQEQNAYLAEFNQILKDNETTINKSDNKLVATLNVIKQTEIWQKYNETNNVIQVFSKLPDAAKELIVYHYKDAKNIKSKSDDSVIKQMVNDWEKMIRTFNTKLSKIVYNYIIEIDNEH